MSRSTHAIGAARDANEPEIRRAFEEVCGAVFWPTAEPVDALVWWLGGYGVSVPQLHAVEIKRPAGPKGGTSGRNLTPAQERFFAAFPAGVRHVVRTVEDVFDLVPRQPGWPAARHRPAVWEAIRELRPTRSPEDAKYAAVFHARRSSEP